jgi:hypothetical protein
MDRIKSFNEFIKESVESNTKEAELLARKEQLLATKKQAVAAKDVPAKTAAEKEIAKLDAEIAQIRQTEEEQEKADERA